jgi:hypothetical protein
MRIAHLADPKAGVCGCGCGARTAIAERTDTARGWVKGQPKRALRGHRVTPRYRESPEKRFWALVAKTDTCWLWQGSTLRGYGLFRFVPGESMRRAHRVAWELTRGTIPLGKYVLHRCDVPHCVNPEHLFLGSQADNMQDASKKGRLPRGSNRASAKLTATQVRAIRTAADAGQSQRSLAREYSVSTPTVRAIVERVTWRWLT